MEDPIDESPRSNNTNNNESIQPSDTAYYNPRGRLGKVRFAVWGTAFLMIPRLLSTTYPIGMFIFPITFTLYIFTILKRLRDIGVSPWWGLIAWVPVLNIPLLFISGDAERNNYGLPPKKHTSSELFFAIFLPIAFIGILASTIVPNFIENYEYYKQKAEQKN